MENRYSGHPGVEGESEEIGFMESVFEQSSLPGVRCPFDQLGGKSLTAIPFLYIERCLVRCNG